MKNNILLYYFLETGGYFMAEVRAEFLKRQASFISSFLAHQSILDSYSEDGQPRVYRQQSISPEELVSQ